MRSIADNPWTINNARFLTKTDFARDAGTTLKLGGEHFGRALAKKPPPPEKKQPRIAENGVCIHNWLTRNC